jgi:RNA polymerase sigma-70 factor (ECF subfamily)
MSGSNTFSELYFRHISELCSFLVMRIHCRETAQELAHESFIRYMGQRSDAVIGNPRALLYRIAGNLAIDHYRAAKSRAGYHVELDDCAELPCDKPGPEQIIAARQMMERLRRAIEALPPKCRSIFMRHKFDGVPHAEIALENGITRNAVEKHLIRALVSLRCAMGDLP